MQTHLMFRFNFLKLYIWNEIEIHFCIIYLELKLFPESHLVSSLASSLRKNQTFHFQLGGQNASDYGFVEMIQVAFHYK